MDLIHNNKMNLKIDRLLPYPPSLTQPYILTFLPSQQALLLYPPPPPQQKQQEPNKKKFAFKANSNAAPVMQQLYIFELARNAWRTQQTKGKSPSRRQFPGVACMGPCMMVYGGKQLNPAKQVNDLYCLHLTTWQWKKLFAMQAPNPSPHPLAFGINDENLLVIGKELWVFCAKGVNWELQKGDLPGGIWQKVQGSQLSFEVRCGTKIGNDLIVFGWDNKIKSASIGLDSKTVAILSVEGELQIAKGQNLQIVNTSDGQGVMMDGVLFGSFMVEDKNIIFNQWFKSDEVTFDRIVPTQLEQNRRNYGITLKKELALVELQMQKLLQEEQSLPITARQIQTDYLKSSVIEKGFQQELSSPMHRSSIKDQATPALTKHLGPLLAGEWMKRRILESKGKLLQESIKKAEKMVLMLCRYGSEDEKRMHINKVRRIREALSESFAQETKWRNTMEQRKGEAGLKQFVLREYGQFYEHFLDFQEE